MRWTAVGLAVLAAQAARGQELNSRIESMIASAKIGQATVGVSIVDLQSGRTLADIRADAPYIPASNQKVLTTGAALIVLGPEFVFKTELVMVGDKLVLRGSGDPALADPSILDRMVPKMTVEGLVSALAAAVNTGEVKRVSEVVADDRIFDREHVHAGWPKDQLDRWYCAPVSGLNFHTNVVSVFPGPAVGGSGPPTIEIEPAAPWLQIENKARTVMQGKNSVWLTRDPVASRYTMYGEVRFPSRVPVEITVFDPAVLFAQLLAAELPKSGVGVGSAPAVSEGQRQSIAAMEQAVSAARLAEAEEKLDDGRVLAVVSTHMKDIIERCNSDSQNLYAEALLKRLGHDVTGEAGSWSSGSSVLRMTISQDPELGPKYAATTVVSDGSGMSRDDRVAPRTLTKWLGRLQGDPKFGEMFIESLAGPGDGTLRRRFHDAKLQGELKAKSGKVDGVRCLCGYMTDPQTGRRVAFSVMVNNLKEGEAALQSLQLHEDVVIAIDRWLVSQRPERETAAVPNQTVTRKPGR
jgi:serine-type D-Ala-D-Ala carboxypeptidase/endopeptidase (penicillin-binding protein 4)